MVMLCTFIDNNNSATHHFSIDNSFIGNSLGYHIKCNT